MEKKGKLSRTKARLCVCVLENKGKGFGWVSICPLTSVADQKISIFVVMLMFLLPDDPYDGTFRQCNFDITWYLHVFKDISFMSLLDHSLCSLQRLVVDLNLCATRAHCKNKVMLAKNLVTTVT